MDDDEDVAMLDDRSEEAGEAGSRGEGSAGAMKSSPNGSNSFGSDLKRRKVEARGSTIATPGTADPGTVDENAALVDRIKSAWKRLERIVETAVGKSDDESTNVLRAMDKAVGDLVAALEEDDEDELAHVIAGDVMPPFQNLVATFIFGFRKEIAAFGAVFKPSDEVPKCLGVLFDETMPADVFRRKYADINAQKKSKKTDRLMKALVDEFKAFATRDPMSAKVANAEVKLIGANVAVVEHSILHHFAEYFPDLLRSGADFGKRMRDQVTQLRKLVELQQALHEQQKICRDDAANSKAQKLVNERLVSLAEASRPLAEVWCDLHQDVCQPWLNSLPTDLHDHDARYSKQAELVSLYFQMPSITLADYNKVSFRFDTEQIRKQAQEWLENATTDGAFKTHVFPIILNILKRGEPWDELVEIGREEIERRANLVARSDLILMWTAKCLFSLVLSRCESVVRFHILGDFRTGLPLLYPHLDPSSAKQGDPLCAINFDIMHHLHENGEASVLSFGVGSSRRPLGKTQMLNEMFRCGFDETPSSFLTYGTCDVDLGFAFEPRRQLAFGDYQGEVLFGVSREQDALTEFLLHSFPYWIIHAHASELPAVRGLASFLSTVDKKLRPKGIIFLVRDLDPQACVGHDMSGDKNFVTNLEQKEHSGARDLRSVVGDLRSRFPGSDVQIDCAGIRNLSEMDSRERSRICRFHVRKFISDFVAAGEKRRPGELFGARYQKRFLEDAGQYAAALAATSGQESSRETIQTAHGVESLVQDLFTHIEGLKDDFSNPKGFATRRDLVEIRSAQQVLEDPTVSAATVKSAKAQKEQLEAKLRQVQPTGLVKSFLKILESPHKVLILALLCVKLKNFSGKNVAKEMARRKEIEDELSCLMRSGGDDIEENESKQKRKNELSVEVRDLSAQIANKRISLEMFWRELTAFIEWGAIAAAPIPGSGLISVQPARELCDFLAVAEPFELIDGDNLRIPVQSLKAAFRLLSTLRSSGKRVLVVSILGPQSSGKSTLLNYLFGCKFSTSKGRCTKGVYGTLQRIDDERASEEYDYLLVLDTEGLQSPDKEDREFDRKIGLLILAMSHVVLINVAKDLNTHMKDLLEICLLSLSCLEKARMTMPELFMVFNQNSGDITDKSVFMDQVKRVSEIVLQANPEARDAAKAMQLSSRQIKVLPLATNSETFEQDCASGQTEDWIRETPAKKFAREVATFADEILESVCGNSQQADVNREKDLEHWLHMLHEVWRTIQQYPDLYRFGSVRIMQQNRELSEYSRKLEKEHLHSDSTEQKCSDVVDSILYGTLREDRILDANHVRAVEEALSAKLSDLFESISSDIESCLSKFVATRKYDSEVVQSYLRSTKAQVESSRVIVLTEAKVRVLEKQHEVSRRKGVAEIDRLVVELSCDEHLSGLDPADPIREEYVKEKSETTWNKLIEDRRKRVNEGEIRAQTWDLVSRAYRKTEAVKLPPCIARDSHFEHELKSELSAVESSTSTATAIGLELTEKTFQADFLCAASPVLQRFALGVPRLEDMHDLYRKCTKDGGVYKYLSPFSFCNVCVEERTIEFDTERHIDWRAIKDKVNEISRENKQDAREEKFIAFRESCGSVGICFSDDFADRIYRAMSGGWLPFHSTATSAVSKILKEYACFEKNAKTATPLQMEGKIVIKADADEMSKRMDASAWIRNSADVRRKKFHTIFVCTSGHWVNNWQNTRAPYSSCTFYLELESEEANLMRDFWKCIKKREKVHYLAKTSLQKFVTARFQWDSALEELEKTLEGILPDDALSSNSIQMARASTTEFIKKSVDTTLTLFGARLDMDGASLFHSFAMLHLWRRASKRAIRRQQKKILEFEGEKDKWMGYVRNIVFADPRGKSRSSAIRFEQEYFRESQNACLQALPALARNKLKHHDSEFIASAIQAELDDALLFNADADGADVVCFGNLC